MRALQCIAANVLPADSERRFDSSILYPETALRRGDGVSRARRQNSRLYRSSVAMLTGGVAVGLLGLTHANTALAQESGRKDLPAIVVVDPAQKPKRSGRPAPWSETSTRRCPPISRAETSISPLPSG